MVSSVARGGSIRRVIAVAVVPLMLLASGCTLRLPLPDQKSSASIDKPELVLGIINAGATVEPRYSALVTLLAKETGKQVSFKEFKTADELSKALEVGSVDIVSAPTPTYIAAKAQGVGLDIIAVGTHRKGTSAGTPTSLWVPVGSNIKTLADLQAKKVCVGADSDVYSYLAPASLLSKAGIDLKSGVTLVAVPGAVPESIKAGKCDAGFGSAQIVTTAVNNKKIKADELAKVWSSAPLVSSVIALNRGSVVPEVASKLTKVFVDKGNVDALRAEKICTDKSCVMPPDATWGFIAGEEKTIAVVYEGCDLTGAASCKKK